MKKRYKIVIEFEAEYVPSDVMDELTDVCSVQLESLTDNTLESAEDRVFEYSNATAKWYRED